MKRHHMFPFVKFKHIATTGEVYSELVLTENVRGARAPFSGPVERNAPRWVPPHRFPVDLEVWKMVKWGFMIGMHERRA